MSGIFCTHQGNRHKHTDAGPVCKSFSFQEGFRKPFTSPNANRFIGYHLKRWLEICIEYGQHGEGKNKSTVHTTKVEKRMPNSSGEGRFMPNPSERLGLIRQLSFQRADDADSHLSDGTFLCSMLKWLFARILPGNAHLFKRLNIAEGETRRLDELLRDMWGKNVDLCR